jgi:OTU domain-containing protein 3
VKDPSPEETAKVKAETPKGVIIHEWMMKSVTSSLPHLAFDQETIRKTLEEYDGRVNDAVDRLLGADYSTPGTPGSLSQSGSSSIERDPDSDDDEIYGPNKRQNRRMSRATKALRKEQEERERREAELQAIPTIELTRPDAAVTSEVLIQSHETAFKSGIRKIKQDDDGDKYIVVSDDKADDDFRPDAEENDAASEYSATSVSQSVDPASTPPRIQQRIILHTKSMQKQIGPQRKRITARERKELKKAAQKQARKESKRNNGQRQLATSTININVKRNSPPIDQVIGMKTLYI